MTVLLAAGGVQSRQERDDGPGVGSQAGLVAMSCDHPERKKAYCGASFVQEFLGRHAGLPQDGSQRPLRHVSRVTGNGGETLRPGVSPDLARPGGMSIDREAGTPAQPQLPMIIRQSSASPAGASLAPAPCAPSASTSFGQTRPRTGRRQWWGSGDQSGTGAAAFDATPRHRHSGGPRSATAPSRHPAPA